MDTPRRHYFSGAYGQGAGDRGGDPRASAAENRAAGRAGPAWSPGVGGTQHIPKKTIPSTRDVIPKFSTSRWNFKSPVVQPKLSKFAQWAGKMRGGINPKTGRYYTQQEYEDKRNERRDRASIDRIRKTKGLYDTGVIDRDWDQSPLKARLANLENQFGITGIASGVNKAGGYPNIKGMNASQNNIIDPSGKVNYASMFGGIGELVPDWLKNVAKTTWGNRDIGSMMQGTQKGLSDWLWGKGMRNLQDLPESAKVWMAHGPKPDDYAKLAAEGFSDIRPASKITNLVSPRAWEQLLSGQNPLASRGVYTAVSQNYDDALKAAGQFAKSEARRGVGKVGDLSKIFGPVQVPRGNFPISGGALLTNQMEVPSGFANKWFGLGDKGAQLGSTPAKGMIKGTAGRLLPGVGAALGIKGAHDYYQSGDYGKSLASLVSAIPGPVGWAGLGAEYGLKGLDRAMTNYRQNPYAPENTLVMNQGGLASLWPR